MRTVTTAIYARKSVVLKKGDTLNLQDEKCRRFLEYEYGDNIDIKCYTDEKSGKDMDRLEMQVLIKDIKAGKILVVCSYKLDRFGRNATDLLNFVELLRQYGVKLHCVDDKINYDPADENDFMTRFLIMFLSLMAEIERNNIKQRVTDSKNYLSALGFWLGGTTPYGYMSVQVPNTNVIPEAAAQKLYVLHEDSTEMRMIDKIFEDYDKEEISYSELAHRCTDAGFEPRFSKKSKKSIVMFDAATIRGMLKNPAYVKATPEVYDWLISVGYKPENISPRKKFDGVHGLLTYGKTSRSNKTEYKDNAEVIVAVAPHIGRIDANLWLRVQDKVLKNSGNKTKKNTKHNNVLLSGGVFRCACCGGLMSSFNRESRKGAGVFYPHYRCENKRKRNGKLCSVENLSATETDEAIIDVLFQKKTEICSSVEYIKNNLQLLEKSHTTHNIIPRLEQAIEAEQSKIDNAVNNMTSGLLNKAALENLNRAIDEATSRIEELKLKIEEEHKRLEDLENRNKSLDLIATKLLNLDKSDFMALPMTEKRAIISLIIDKVEWDGTQVHIYFKIPDEVCGGSTTDTFFIETALTNVDMAKPLFSMHFPALFLRERELSPLKTVRNCSFRKCPIWFAWKPAMPMWKAVGQLPLEI